MRSQPFFIPAVIFVVISVPLVLGIVPPNRIYGVRTRRSLSSPEVWRRTNRVAGWGVLAASVFYLEVTRSYPYIPAARDFYKVLLIHIAAWAGPLVAALVIAVRYSKKVG
jgi:uncharacterized membrane protein